MHCLMCLYCLIIKVRCSYLIRHFIISTHISKHYPPQKKIQLAKEYKFFLVVSFLHDIKLYFGASFLILQNGSWSRNYISSFAFRVLMSGQIAGPSSGSFSAKSTPIKAKLSQPHVLDLIEISLGARGKSLLLSCLPYRTHLSYAEESNLSSGDLTSQDVGLCISPSHVRHPLPSSSPLEFISIHRTTRSAEVLSFH